MSNIGFIGQWAVFIQKCLLTDYFYQLINTIDAHSLAFISVCFEKSENNNRSTKFRGSVEDWST